MWSWIHRPGDLNTACIPVSSPPTGWVMMCWKLIEHYAGNAAARARAFSSAYFWKARFGAVVLEVVEG